MDYADEDNYYGDDDSSVDDEPYGNEEAVQGMITKWSPPKPIEIAAFNPATADDGFSDDETDPLRLVQKARRENKALHDFCSDQLKTIDAALTINQRLRIAAEEAQAERENWLKTRTKSRETPVRPTVIITPRDSNGSATPPPDGDSAAAAGPSNLAMTLPASSSSTALSTNLRPLPQRTEDAQRRAALAAAVPVRPAAERRSRRWTNQECARLRRGIIEQLIAAEEAARSSAAAASPSPPVSQSDWFNGLKVQLAEPKELLENVDVIKLQQALGHGVDWEALNVPGRTARECESQWTQRDDPQLKPYACTKYHGTSEWRTGGVADSLKDVEFAADEISALRDLVEEHGLHSWEAVAKDLGERYGYKGRTSMACLRAYIRLIEDPQDPDDGNGGEGTKAHWTPEEDKALADAILRTGNCKDWAAVALLIPGRNRKQCLLRWNYCNLGGERAMKTGKWTPAEDDKLKALVDQYGEKSDWKLWVPLCMGGRDHKQCKERWRNHIGNTLSKETWEEWENSAMLEAIQELGTSGADAWKKVLEKAGLTERRSMKNAQEQYRKIQRAQKKEEEQQGGQGGPSSLGMVIMCDRCHKTFKGVCGLASHKSKGYCAEARAKEEAAAAASAAAAGGLPIARPMDDHGAGTGPADGDGDGGSDEHLQLEQRSSLRAGDRRLSGEWLSRRSDAHFIAWCGRCGGGLAAREIGEPHRRQSCYGG